MSETSTATRRGRLTRDITAREMAVDAEDWKEDGGYPPFWIVGPAGTTVEILSTDDTCFEVTGFAEDDGIVGFIGVYDIEEDDGEVGGGVQQVYVDIREWLEVILGVETDPQMILVSLDDALSNNWDELMASFWRGIEQDRELTRS